MMIYADIDGSGSPWHRGLGEEGQQPTIQEVSGSHEVD
jgi:hypothetical protein